VAGGVSLSPPAGRAWLGLAAAWGLASVLAWFAPATLLDWQPALAASEPWRALTAIWVHWSPRHLAANLLGVAVVAALGWRARLPARATAAWALAWPLTQAGLLLRPDLAHYGGLSGVLHAGVAIAAWWLLLQPPVPRGRWVGGAIAVGMTIKLLLEAPWGPSLRPAAPGGEWDIAVAPIAHASGSVAGLACAAALWAAGRGAAGRARMAR
jgi:rhomboid family GlyGly-CTERM serine protease